MFAVVAILLFLIFAINDGVKRYLDRNSQRVPKQKFTRAKCKTCGKEYVVSTANISNNLFKKCPDCRSEAILKGKIHKQRIIEAYKQVGKQLKLKAQQARSLEFQLSPVKELQRIQSLVHENNVSKGYFFENYVADILKINGFKKVQVSRLGPDDGIDLQAQKDGINYGIQCKFYLDGKIGNQTILQFAGAIFNKKLDRGLFITTADFTKSSRALDIHKGDVIEIMTFDTFHKKFILPHLTNIPFDRFYRIPCENYQCSATVLHDILLEVTNCEECGRLQKRHKNYMDL